MRENPKAAIPIEVQEIVMPRVKRIKKMVNTEQLATFFQSEFSGTMEDNEDRVHWMQVYALLAAFDAEITREAFVALAVDILNMRAFSACCSAIQQVAINQQNAQLTDEVIARSHIANRNQLNAAATEAGRMLALIAQCRGQEDNVN